MAIASAAATAHQAATTKGTTIAPPAPPVVKDRPACPTLGRSHTTNDYSANFFNRCSSYYPSGPEDHQQSQRSLHTEAP